MLTLFSAVCRNLPHHRMLTIQMSVRSACIWVFPSDRICLEIKQSLESCQRASVYSEYKNQAAKPQAWVYLEYRFSRLPTVRDHLL